MMMMIRGAQRSGSMIMLMLRFMLMVLMMLTMSTRLIINDYGYNCDDNNGAEGDDCDDFRKKGSGKLVKS